MLLESELLLKKLKDLLEEVAEKRTKKTQEFTKQRGTRIELSHEVWYYDGKKDGLNLAIAIMMDLAAIAVMRDLTIEVQVKEILQKKVDRARKISQSLIYTGQGSDKEAEQQ